MKHITILIKLVFFLFIISSIIGCAVFAPRKKIDDRLVGLWIEKRDNAYSVILRKSDGTYLEKAIQSYDLDKPPIEYLCEGRWWTTKQQYWYIMDFVSTPVWKNSIGKIRSLGILKINDGEFKRLSSDNADVVEKRIGDASEELFEKTPLEPLKEEK